MKARTRFLKMYNELPEQARTELVIDFSTNPKTLRVCYWEIFHDTELGKILLSKLGYKDE